MSDDEQDDAPRTLERVARALNVPIERFYAPGPSATPISAPPPLLDEMEQSLELLRLFLSLEDPVARHRCVTYVREQAACVRRPASGSAP